MTHLQTADVHHAEFCDIDQYVQALNGHAGVSIQLGSGILNILLCEIVFPDLVVRRIRTNLKIEETFFVQPGWTTFSLSPGADIANAVWCGVQSVPNAIGILRSGREHHTCIPGGWDALEIDMPDELMINEGIVPDQLLEKAMLPEEGLLPLSVKSAYQLRHLLLSLLENANTKNRACKDKKLASTLRQQVIKMLADTLDDSLKNTKQRIQRHPYKRYSLLQLMNQKIERQSWKDLTVETLANDLEITIRTLQRIFKEYYQTSPYQYLLRRRLNAARSELHQSHKNAVSIASIADYYGFGSSSQFAEHYKKIFDELPSVTLSRQSN